MATAFQSDGFQNDAFQIDAVVAGRPQSPVVRPQAGSRSRRPRRHHAIILRAPVAPLVAAVRPRVLVVTQDRGLARRRHSKARLLRALSVATATPLVRKRIVQTPNGNDRAQTVARAFRRHRAHITLRAIPTPAVPPQPTRAPVISRNRRAARVRATVRDRVRFVRSFVAPVRPPRVTTGSAAARRAATVRLTRRHRVRLVVPRVVLPVAVRQPQPRVVRQRAAQRIRYTRTRQPIMLRGPLVVTGGRRTITTIRIVRNRRAATVRAYYPRHGSHLATSTLGAAAPSVSIGAFDEPTLASTAYDAATETSAAYDDGIQITVAAFGERGFGVGSFGGSDGFYEDDKRAATFDKPSPGQKL